MNITRFLLAIVMILFMSSQLLAHGNHHYSKFIISQSDEKFELEIEILKEDFDMLSHDYTAFGNTNEERLLHYLNHHFCLSFNNISIELQSIEIEEKANYLFVRIPLKSPVRKVREVRLFNNCFLALVNEHTNVAVFRLNDTERFFNLHNERKQTEFTY